MGANRLQLNAAKTEILWCSSERRVDQLPSLPFLICGSSVGPSSVVRDLGVWIDNGLTMSTHITKVVAGCFDSLRQLRSVRRSLSHKSFTRLVVALVLAVVLLQRSPGWTSCQSTQPTAVRSPRGGATDLRRPSLRPRYTTAATVALAVSARTSDIQTLRHGVSLSVWYRPWILLGRLQARVRDSISPTTALGLQYRHRGSCHTPVFTWRPSNSQSQELERGTHCRPVSPPHHLCPHSSDSWRHFFSSDNGVNNTNYCVVVLKCLALSTTLILVKWTELSPWFRRIRRPLIVSDEFRQLTWSHSCAMRVCG